MSHSLLELAYQLTRDEEPFVLATVVWCERPTSAKPGAQALIQSDGRLTGWIGGSCAQPVVVREAVRLLREGGEPLLLRLGSPEIGIERRNVRIFPMTCTSGGALDIYMEPHLPLPRLLLVGDSPVNVALSQLAPVLNFSVAQLDQDALALLTSEPTFWWLPTANMMRTCLSMPYGALPPMSAWLRVGDVRTPAGTTCAGQDSQKSRLHA